MIRHFRFDPPAADFRLLRNQGFFPGLEIDFVGLPDLSPRMPYSVLRARLEMDHPRQPGQAHAEWCIWCDMFPEDLRSYLLVFFGTEWQHTKDGNAIIYTYYAGGAWNLGLRYQTLDFHDGFKFAVYKK